MIDGTHEGKQGPLVEISEPNSFGRVFGTISAEHRTWTCRSEDLKLVDG